MNNEDYMSIYEDMLLEVINKGDVMVTDLNHLGSPRSGFSGTMSYYGRGIPFEGEIVADDEPFLHFSVPFGITVDNRYREKIEYLMIMTNYLIIGEGVILHDMNDSIYLSRSVSLVETVTVDYVNDTMKTIAAIAYAFIPYYEVVNNGEMSRLKTNYGGSLLAKMIYHLISNEVETSIDNTPWIDEVNYRDERFYQILTHYYDRKLAHIDQLLSEYEMRKMLLEWANDRTKERTSINDDRIDDTCSLPIIYYDEDDPFTESYLDDE